MGGPPIKREFIAVDDIITCSPSTTSRLTSLLAMWLLARKKGYELVHCGSDGRNAFFVRRDLLANGLVAKYPAEAYRPRPKK